MAVPTSSVSMIEPGYVRQRAAALVLEGKDDRVLVLRALPRWDGEPTLQLDGRIVHVRAGISQLAILNAYAELPDGDYLVVLTDRSRQDLGDAVLTRAWRGDVELPDLWEAVPALFRARGVTRELRRIGPWVPAALLAHSPTAGWPASPGPEVTADFALSNLIAHLLGLPLPETLDPDLVLTVLGTPAARAAWTAVDPALRGRLVDWAAEDVGPAVAFALRAGATSRAVAPLAVGLAVEALANGDVSTGQQRGQAAGLLFARHLGGTTLSTAEARDVGRAARVAVSRRMVTDPDGARDLLTQAQALLGDLGWAEGATASDLLPAGLLARLRAVGASLEKGADGAETALRHLLDHMLARPDDATVLTARMAVRLARWLTVEESFADTLATSLRRHLDEGAWVDRALGLVWQGSEDPELSTRYAALVAAVRARRTEQDRAAALQLAAHASFPHPVEGAVAIEDVLSQVVKPWSVGVGVLLVVLDGMGASVSTEVAEAAQELGLVEWVPNNGRRMCALAALPSLTETSRATLLSGALTTGTGPAEKKGLAAAFPGASLFHKDDLRATAGAQLPPAVMAAIAATGTQPVVGVVINTIDDTLHKQDPSSTRWTLDRLTPLKSLLSEARTAGRTVILTSDHGHVVERTTEARSMPGASARWREVATGPAGEGEVLVSGRRVLTPLNQAVLLWREDVHYGPRQTGYHGGASLAEVTVPVIVLRSGFEVETSRTAGPTAWKPAAPQAPEWWNEPARATDTQTPVAPTLKKAGRPEPSRPDLPLFELEETIPGVNAGGDLADAVLASAAYAAQRTRAGRRSADDATVVAVLRALLSRSNRCHRDTLATAVGVPAGALEPTLAAVKRLLNIDGYPVIEQDADQVTLKLDEMLLREQFELGGS